MKHYLRPSIEDIRLECVLIQAWKKTSAYLRSHSWYADTLGLDYESLRLPRFINEIQERLQEPQSWKSNPIELVPAPKNQRWVYRDNKWKPRPREKIREKMRPLAHVDLQDQVVATAIMLCLADRVESALGDPCRSIKIEGNRRKVLAYGHRLFCDKDDDGQLRHRWGSSKLYRQYFQDYQTFLERPKVVVRQLKRQCEDTKFEIAVVKSDLSKFYDTVRPVLLWDKLRNFQHSSEEDPFFNLAGRVLNWQWSDQSRDRADRFAQDSNHVIGDLRLVALPQGLVTAGFFANVVLRDLDVSLREQMGRALPNGKLELFLEDVCYYVDDIRLVLKVPRNTHEEDIKEDVTSWLQNLLDKHAKGLIISKKEKTEVTVEGREERFLVRQSSEANRIQSQVSDTFDALRGTELIAAIEGFFNTQQRYSVELDPELKDTGLLVGVPDMRDDTVARFAAGKFRRTFRSLRPLLTNDQEPSEPELEDEGATLPHQLVLTKEQLDERARFFSAHLIEEWIKNPGNVRLLRIALDIYPDYQYLKRVLKLLGQGWRFLILRNKAAREVRLYCLAELFRAGATETGIVQEEECLPDNLDIEKYHAVLVKEAQELLDSYIQARAKKSRFPWYLMQQVFLYLGARNAFPEHIVTQKARREKLLSKYWQLAKFMSGQISITTTLEQRTIFLVIVKTGYGIPGYDFLGSKTQLSDKFLSKVERISPLVARELWQYFRNTASEQVARAAERLGLEQYGAKVSEGTIAEVAGQETNPFYEEENLLQLVCWLLSSPEFFRDTVTPWNIRCAVSGFEGYEFGKTEEFGFEKAVGKATHLFEPPDWCESDEERQKFQIGLLLRYALRGSTNFLSSASSRKSSRGLRYRKPISHWEQQRYSGYQGRDAFGLPWLPMSSFTEDILFQLLRWPGAGIMQPEESIAELLGRVGERLEKLFDRRGEVTSATFLEQTAPWPGGVPKRSWECPLRIGVVQSIIPSSEEYKRYKNDPELLSDSSFRNRQRRHLSAIMGGVSQMLFVRDTHREQARSDGRVIDLLIFPELAIHPQDIDPLILPFVRRHKCIVLFGQVYHRKDSRPGSPIINSCLWMIPDWSRADGLQIRRIEQGKKHLTREERCLTPAPVPFRPAQWLIEYQWHSDHRPLTLSASVCYDATDLALAADLRSRSDLYIICALNKDVGTFDRMAEALHYHMFQGVIVVNNGQFGGSNFYMPFKETFHRQVFHVHGQPQVSISFAEIDPRKLLERPDRNIGLPEGYWKTPPAGWND